MLLCQKFRANVNAALRSLAVPTWRKCSCGSHTGDLMSATYFWRHAQAVQLGKERVHRYLSQGTKESELEAKAHLSKERPARRQLGRYGTGQRMKTKGRHTFEQKTIHERRVSRRLNVVQFLGVSFSC